MHAGPVREAFEGDKVVTRQADEASKVIEGFAVEATEGLIFTVKGLVHPADRLVAYLRYLPHAQGDRKRRAVRYQRVYQFEEQRRILLDRFPDYINHDSAFGIELQGVPWEDVRKIYNPCRRLANIREHGAEDPLDESALAFAGLLKDAAGVPMDSLGISGSVLLGLHRPDSDLDLVVYGEREGHAVHGALRRLLASPSVPVRKLERHEMIALHASHQADTPLSFTDFARLQSRKVNEGHFAESPYFIRFVKRREEVDERYADPRFEPLGSATIQCRVRDHRDAIFTPCLYQVENVVFLGGKPVNGVREVVAFRGRFSDQARTGERIVAKGRLERVTSAAGQVHHRLTVGGQAGDYLLSKPPA